MGFSAWYYTVWQGVSFSFTPCASVLIYNELACGRQAFIATWLFDPSMSALPIILKQNSVSVGLFTRLRERELG